MIMPKNPGRNPHRLRLTSLKPPVTQKQLPPPPQDQTTDCSVGLTFKQHGGPTDTGCLKNRRLNQLLENQNLLDLLLLSVWFVFRHLSVQNCQRDVI